MKKDFNSVISIGRIGSGRVVEKNMVLVLCLCEQDVIKKAFFEKVLYHVIFFFFRPTFINKIFPSHLLTS